MNLIDRLIIKAQKLGFAADVVFLISNETGKWVVDGKEFPALEDAQRYAEELISGDDQDSVIIINDLGPCDPDSLNELAVPAGWQDRIWEEEIERRAQEQEEERRNRLPKKDRRLI